MGFPPYLCNTLLRLLLLLLRGGVRTPLILPLALYPLGPKVSPLCSSICFCLAGLGLLWRRFRVGRSQGGVNRKPLEIPEAVAR